MQLPEQLTFFTGKVSLGGECWNFTGSRDKRGYGHVSHSGKSWRAHRLSYHLFHGSIPTGLNVCHKCDNPSCIRPDHLFAGTQKDNLSDCRDKGRLGVWVKPECRPTGLRNGNYTHPEKVRHGERVLTSKLNQEAVRWIRENTGKVPQIQMAKQLNVSRSAIYRVQRGEHWRQA